MLCAAWMVATVAKPAVRSCLPFIFLIRFSSPDEDPKLLSESEASCLPSAIRLFLCPSFWRAERPPPPLLEPTLLECESAYRGSPYGSPRDSAYPPASRERRE